MAYMLQRFSVGVLRTFLSGINFSLKVVSTADRAALNQAFFGTKVSVGLHSLGSSTYFEAVFAKMKTISQA